MFKPFLRGGWEIVNSGSENDAELNPMTFYKSLQSHEMCWMLQKGVYDPCPYGWHVPRGDEAGIWCVSGLGDAMFDTTHQGWLYRMEDSGMDVWYPAAGFRDCYNDTDIWGIGNAASYWSCSRTNITNNYRYSAFGLYFGIDESVASYVYDLDYGCSVRCQKEEWL